MARLLIADDNPVSLRFLADAVGMLGHDTATAPDGRHALALATTQRFDALLLDLSMPVLGGHDVLVRLRQDGHAESRHAPAIATSAEVSPEQVATLRASGFRTVLVKPTDVAALATAIAVALEDSRIADRHSHLLDAESARAATGDPAIVHALRTLFVGELEALPTQLRTMIDAGDVRALRDRLHRLRASCGFCGAPALDLACSSLAHAVDERRDIADAVAEFLDLADATRCALLEADTTP
jgi:CheY-like chemotaxis protein/HPt (histidine-containing phosphotransfer) domain-containing protein